MRRFYDCFWGRRIHPGVNRRWDKWVDYMISVDYMQEKHRYRTNIRRRYRRHKHRQNGWAKMIHRKDNDLPF